MSYPVCAYWHDHPGGEGLDDCEVAYQNAKARMQRTYQDARTADNAWQAEIVRVYGSKAAPNARYDERGKATPKLRELSDAKHAADEARRRAGL